MVFATRPILLPHLRPGQIYFDPWAAPLFFSPFLEVPSCAHAALPNLCPVPYLFLPVEKKGLRVLTRPAFITSFKPYVGANLCIFFLVNASCIFI